MRAFTRRITLLTIAALTVLLFLPESAPAQSGPYGVVAPTTLNFQVLVGQTSPPQNVTLKNTGDSELAISSISISGDFALPINHCARGVKPGTHCNVYVTFTPPGLGTVTGTLTFTDNASNSPQTVLLTGTGVDTPQQTKTGDSALPREIQTGQEVTITATVKSKGGVIPDGEQITFKEDGSFIGYGTLDSGTATLTTPIYGVNGRYHVPVGAWYPGDQYFDPSHGVTHVGVIKYDSSTTLASNTNPSVYGEPIAFTATVVSDGPYSPTGNTDFTFPGQRPKTEATGNGVATYLYKTLTPTGSYSVGVKYKGDGNNYSSDGSAAQIIGPSTTTTSVKSSKDPSRLGQAVTFSVIVKAPWWRVGEDGSVTFTSGGNILGTVELNDSKGAITTTSLPIGQNTITAAYTPSDGNFLGSSATLVQTENQ